MNKKILPKKIKVGCCDYTIEEIVIDNEDDYVGRCVPNQQLIQIELRLTKHKKVQTLFHEVLHAICFEHGNIKISEQKLDTLASGIVAVLKDNPEMRGLL